MGVLSRMTRVKSYGSRLGQREKLGHEAVLTHASAMHGKHGTANMTLWKSPEVAEGTGPLHPCTDQPLNVGLL